MDKTKLVQVDVDGTEIGRNFPVALGVVSDAKLFLEDLAAAGKANPKHEAWIKKARGYRDAWLKEIEPIQKAKTAPTHPARLCYEVGEAIGDKGIAYIDIGDCTQYAEAYMFVRRPGAWQISPGMAEMGWAASGVVGGVAADPTRPAVCITGDGAFNLVNQAVCTAVEYNLPAVWVILNNYEFGIERKGMERSYQRSHPWCTFTRRDTGERYNPDYVQARPRLWRGGRAHRGSRTSSGRRCARRSRAGGRGSSTCRSISPSAPTSPRASTAPIPATGPAPIRPMAACATSRSSDASLSRLKV